MMIPNTYSEDQESRTDSDESNARRSPLKHVNSVFSRHNSRSPSIKSAKSTSSFMLTVDCHELFTRTLHGTLVMYTHDSRSFGQRVAPLPESQFLGTFDYNKAVTLRYLDP